ncbi:hypothetical protein KV097_05140 [Mumia sp. zg.B17]|uniref:hypothetical protein n=1 Tax=unclassified Mumia TaxID=2621872 RepID=UPI001C6ECBAA|nr:MULTISPECIES: hypothetical protein [unclassified Mumia]MBW9205322.1 hypothetical protein [Mumia sp. zg.B17]MBW9208679.1 hypothetical protein [Mumia sp. zg.B21]MDD9348089.1 hypothetical protein [Mumia sp.]
MTATTFRIGDGQPVAYETALHFWVKSAREVLVEKAREYGGDVTDQDLAAEVQRRTGVKAQGQSATWIGDVLAEVAADAHERGEPAITSLCVRADGTVADGYREAVARVTGSPVADPDRHAAAQRFACYQRYGAPLPSDGGRPRPSSRVAAHAPRTSRREPTLRKVERPGVVCPRCFLEMPATGVCDSCG